MGESPRGRKRKAEDNEEESLRILKAVGGQAGVRSQLVLLYGECDNPFNILQSAASNVGVPMSIARKSNGAPGSKRLASAEDEQVVHLPPAPIWELKIGEEVIASGEFTTENQARAVLPNAALEELKRCCFSIIKKTRVPVVENTITKQEMIGAEEAAPQNEPAHKGDAGTDEPCSSKAGPKGEEPQQQPSCSKALPETGQTQQQPSTSKAVPETEQLQQQPSSLKAVPETGQTQQEPSTSKEVAETGQPQQQSSFVKFVGGLGERMLRGMGWMGGGLGAQEQGQVDIIEPVITVDRRGLGSADIPAKVAKMLHDLRTSRNMTGLAFARDFSSEERAGIHKLCRRYNLISKSYGKGDDRYLIVRNRFSRFELVRRLIESKGETEEYLLVNPTDF